MLLSFDDISNMAVLHKFPCNKCIEICDNKDRDHNYNFCFFYYIQIPIVINGRTIHETIGTNVLYNLGRKEYIVERGSYCKLLYEAYLERIRSLINVRSI